MLRYKTKSRPGLVALCDIRPGNGAGPFLQPRSLHGAQSQGLTIHSQGLISRPILLTYQSNDYHRYKAVHVEIKLADTNGNLHRTHA